MSNVIDEQVVSMKFDNSNFEKNVSTSMSTIEKLKASISNISKTSNVNPLGESIQAVGEKFSWLEQIGIGALRKIGADAVQQGKVLLKAFTVDNLTTGWKKFEDLTVNTATMIAQGFDMSEVENQLERLAWFTDETSYNFTEMVGNIGKFTATGQGLTDSVQAMEGIATWAALSGQNAQKASMAMYQLSQAMGKGALKYDDYKSIQNASMDTKEFRQHAVDAAVALGTLKKTGEDTYTTLQNHTFKLSQFTEYLSKDAWLTSNVMMKVFKEYSSAVDAIYEYSDATGTNATETLNLIRDISDEAEKAGVSADEIIDKMYDGDEAIKALIASADEFGIKAFKAAQNARTWTDAIDATKDAVSSKWMSIYKSIIGNSEEATDVFSNLAEIMYEVFVDTGVEGVKTLDVLLDEWKQFGGRTRLWIGLNNILEGLVNTIQAVKEAFFNVFPRSTITELLNLTNKFVTFTRKLQASEETMEKIKWVFRGFFSIFKSVGEVFKQLFKALNPGLDTTKSILSVILDVLSAIGKFNYAVAVTIEKTQIITKLLDFAKLALIGIAAIIAAPIIGIITLINKIKDLEFTKNIVEGIKTAFELLVKTIQNGAETLTKFVEIIKVKMGDVFKDLGASMTEFSKKFKNFFEDLKNGKSPLEALFGGEKNETASGFIEKLSIIKNGIHETFGDQSTKKLQTMEGTTSKLASGFEKIKEALSPVIDGIKNFISQLTPANTAALILSGTLVAFAVIFGKLVASISNTNNGIARAANSFSTFTNTLNKAVSGKFNKKKEFTKYLLEIAVSIGILTASIAALTMLPIDKVKEAGLIILTMMATLTACGIAMTLITKNLESSKTAPLVLLGMATSVLILAAAMKVLDGIDLNNSIGSLAILVTVSSLLAGLSMVLTHANIKVRTAATLLIFCLGLEKVAKSLATMTSLDFDNIKNNLTEFAAVIAAIAVLTVAASNINVGSALGILAISLFIESITPLIASLVTGINFGKVLESLMQYQTVILAIGAIAVLATLAAGALGKDISRFGIGLASLVGAAFLMTKVVDAMSKLNPDTIGQGLAGMALMLSFFIGFAAISKLIDGKEMAKFSASLLLVTLAMAGMAGIVAIMSLIPTESFKKGLSAIAVFGAIVVALENVSNNCKKFSMANMISLTVMTGVLFTEMLVLSLIPWEKLTKAGVAMVAVLGGITASLRIIGDSKWSKNKTAAFGVAIAGLLTIAGSLYLLSDFSWQQMATSVLSIGGVIAALTVLLRNISKSSGLGDQRTFLGKLSTIGAVTAALVAIAGSLALLANMKPNRVLVASIALGSVMGALIPIFQQISKMSISGINKVKGLMAFALIIAALGTSLAAVATQPWQQILVAMVALGGIMGAFIGFAAAMDEIGPELDFKTISGLSLSMIALSASMLIAAPAFERFASLDFPSILKGISVLAAFTSIMAGAGALSKIMGPYFAAGIGIMSAALIAASAAFTLFGYGLNKFLLPALITLSEYKEQLTGVGDIMREVAGGIALLAAAGLAMTLGGPGFIVFGVGMAAMAGGLALLGLAINSVLPVMEKLLALPMKDLILSCAGFTAAMFLLSVAAGLATAGMAALAIGIALLGVGLGTVGISLTLLAAGVGLVGTAMQSVVNAIDYFAQAVGNLNSVFTSIDYHQVADGMNAILEPVKELIKMGSNLIPFGLSVIEMGLAIYIAGAGVNNMVKALAALNAINMDLLKEKIKGLCEAITEFFNTPTVTSKFLEIFKTVNEVILMFGETANTIAPAFRNLAGSFIVLGIAGLALGLGVIPMALAAGALALLNLVFQKIDTEHWTKVNGVLAGLAGASLLLGVGGAILGLGIIPLLGLAAALVALNYAVGDKDTKWWEDLNGGLAGLAGACALLGAASVLLTLGSIGLLAAGAALSIMALVAGDCDWTTFGDGLIHLAGGLALVGAAGIVLDLAAIGLLAMAVSLAVIIEPLERLCALGDSIGVLNQDLPMLALGFALVGASGLLLLAGAPGVTAMAEAMLIMSEAVLNLSESFTQAINDIKAVLSGSFVSEMGEMGVNAVAGFVDGIKGKLGNVVEAGKSVANSIKETICNLLEIHSPSDWFRWVAEMCVKGWTNTFGDSESTISQIVNEVTQNGIIDTIKSHLPEMSELGSSFGGDFIDGIKNTLSSIKNGTFDLSTAKDAILDAFPIARTLADTDALLEDLGLGDITSDIENALGSAGGAATKTKSAFEELRDSIKNSMDIFTKFEKKEAISANTILENMRSQVNGIASWAADISMLATKGIDVGLLNKLKDMGPQGANYVDAFGQMTAEQIQEANLLWQQSLTLPDSAAGLIQSSFKSAGTWMGNGLDQGIDTNMGVDKLHEAFLNEYNQFCTDWGIASPSKVMIKLGGYMNQGLKNGIEETQDRPIKQMKVLTEAIRMITEDNLNSDYFADIGKNICIGLKDGITKNSEEAINAATDMMSKINERSAAIPQVESPSKVFRSIGFFIDKGLELGIKDSSDKPISAAEAMSQNVVNAFANAKEALKNAISSNIDINPVIRPTLDLSNVKSQAGAISGLFNEREIAANGNLQNGSNSGNGSGNNITFNQYNNSPKALSRIDIYRQTKNQISQLRSTLG